MFEFLFNNGKFYGFRVSEDNYGLPFHEAPVLWTASQSLFQAAKSGTIGAQWKDQLKPLHKEISALCSAVSSEDELSRTVINAIPKEAKNRGIFPEEALKQRFVKVEKLARRVDLVPAGGASLLVHILSYIHSLLIIKTNKIPQKELNDEKVDLSKLGTDDILHRAKFWLDRGNLVQALKYMNLLRGASRVVAKQWMHEAKFLLETLQAANILMAHATSCGLKYL